MRSRLSAGPSLRWLAPLLALVGVAFFAAVGRAEPVPVTAPSPALSRVEAALANVQSLSWPGKEGYATVWDGNKYVQCRGGPEAPWRCEAAGYLMQPSLEPVLTPDRTRRLVADGWRLDSSFGNFVRFFPSTASTSVVAGAVIRALTEGYDAELDKLELQTAWVAAEPCPPRNGPTQNLAGMVNDARSMAATAVHVCAYTPDSQMTTAGVFASAQTLIDRDGPAMAAHLQRLRINASRDVYAAFDTGIGYVQCAPVTAPDGLYCEAQSAESWAALSAILTPTRVAELHADGYADPGRAPNYSKTYTADKYDDAAVARELLTILFDVYGYNGRGPITVKTEMSQ